MLDDKGAAWLTLGSFWSGIKVISINTTTGKVAAGASVGEGRWWWEGGSCIFLVAQHP